MVRDGVVRIYKYDAVYKRGRVSGLLRYECMKVGIVSWNRIGTADSDRHFQSDSEKIILEVKGIRDSVDSPLHMLGCTSCTYFD